MQKVQQIYNEFVKLTLILEYFYWKLCQKLYEIILDFLSFIIQKYVKILRNWLIFKQIYLETSQNVYESNVDFRIILCQITSHSFQNKHWFSNISAASYDEIFINLKFPHDHFHWQLWQSLSKINKNIFMQNYFKDLGN